MPRYISLRVHLCFALMFGLSVLILGGCAAPAAPQPTAAPVQPTQAPQATAAPPTIEPTDAAPTAETHIDTPRIIPTDEVKTLDSALAKFNLSSEDFAVAHTVTYALPGGVSEKGEAIVMMSIARTKPPTTDKEIPGEDTPIGILLAKRELQLLNNQVLKQGNYVVLWRGQEIRFMDEKEEITPFSVQAVFFTTTENADPPETTISGLICQSWLTRGVCYEPSRQAVLTPQETKTIHDQISVTYNRLREKGLVGDDAIDLEQAISAVEGRAGVGERQASMIVAPAQMGKTADPREGDGPVLGIAQVIFEINIPGFDTIPSGEYVIRLDPKSDRQSLWYSVNGDVIQIPLMESQDLEPLERPFVELGTIYIRVPVCNLNGCKWKRICIF